MTKVQIRQRVGYNALGPRFWVSTCTTNGTTTTLTDTRLRGGADDKNGSFIIFGSGTDLGTVVVVADDDGAGVLTFSPAVNADSVDSGDPYELWPDDTDPRMVGSFMDDAIVDVTGRVFDPEEDISLHLHPDQLRYDIPSQFTMIQRLEQRVSVRKLLLDACDTVWSTIHANVTASVDTEVRRRAGALKLVTGDQADGDALAQETTETSDISKYTHLEYWIRCTTTLTAADLQIVLSDSGGEEERLSIPAVGAADNWEYQRIALASPEDDTAITTIEIEANHASNVDSKTIWTDEFFVMDEPSSVWNLINNNRYTINVQARDIVFKQAPEYGLLKIVGGDKPVLFTADTTASEVDDYYVIAYTTAAVLSALSDGSTDNSRKLADWRQRAEAAKGGFPALVDVRKLS